MANITIHSDATISIGLRQIAVLDFTTNTVKIVTTPEPFDFNRYNDVEEWLCCPDGAGFDQNHIQFMSCIQ